MLSSSDLRYLESNYVVRLGDFLIHHLTENCPDDPFTSCAAALAPLAMSPDIIASVSIPKVPPPSRPLPAHQSDYLQQLRIAFILEEWLLEVVQEKPANIVGYSYRYFLRNANSRRKPSAVSTGAAAAATRAPSTETVQLSLAPTPLPLTQQQYLHPNHSFSRGRSPVLATDRRSPHSDGRRSPRGDDGYNADVASNGARSALSSRSPVSQRGESPSAPPPPPPDDHADASPPTPRPPSALSETVSSATVSPMSSPSPKMSSVDRPSSPSASPQMVLQQYSGPRKILVMVYSLLGHCDELAAAVMDAIFSTAMELDPSIVIEPHMFRFPETLPKAELQTLVEEQSADPSRTVAEYESDDPRYIPPFDSNTGGSSSSIVDSYSGFLFVFPVVGWRGKLPPAVSSWFNAFLLKNVSAPLSSQRKPAAIIVDNVAACAPNERGEFQKAVEGLQSTLTDRLALNVMDVSMNWVLSDKGGEKGEIGTPTEAKFNAARAASTWVTSCTV